MDENAGRVLAFAEKVNCRELAMPHWPQAVADPGGRSAIHFVFCPLFSLRLSVTQRCPGI